MTGQLGHPVADLSVEHPKKALDADLFEMRFAAPLTVELREVAGPRVTAHGRTDPLRPREHVRQDARVVMHVMVRIHVGGPSACELEEAPKLALELLVNAFRLPGVQLEMEADAQRPARTPERGRLLAGRPVHHEARAREDALAMRLDDAAIHSTRDAEVVGGDNEPSHGIHSSSGGRSAAK